MPSQVSVLELKVGAAFKRPKGFELAGTWLGFGDEIEVLAPPALRERMAQQAGAVLALYG